MQKLFNWFKNNYELFATVFLLAFIPLYPKLPIFDVVHTWVYIRLDDFLIALFTIIFLVRLYRTKHIPETPLTGPIFIYWGIGAISVAYSLAFIGPKLLGYFPQLVFLHYTRRIEYMIVFFIAAAGIKTQRNIKHFLTIFITVVLLVSLYGFGQRFLRFPAILTMNEEFAKGVPLILSPSSRISSTFAGHYDLAMYLAFALTIFSSIFFAIGSVAKKLGLLVVSVVALGALLLTQSRVSLAVLGIGVLFVLWWQRKRLFVIPILLSSLLIPFIPGISDRFAKTFRDKLVVFDIRAGMPIGPAIIAPDGEVTIEKSASPALENLPIGSGYIRLPRRQMESVLASFAVSELRRSPDYPQGDEKPSLGEELQMAMERNAIYLSSTGKLAKSTGEVASVSGRFFLDRAILYDISFTTRLQGEWPKAWEAFTRNTLLGSGYSVLSLASDNDYLRALGETGLFGFASFFLIPIVFFLYVRKALAGSSPLISSLAIGTVAATIGLLITATLIDTFEASKVAYVLWLTIGATTAALGIRYKRRFPLEQEIRHILTHPITIIFLLFLFVPIVYKNVTSMFFVADDFTWLRWAGQSRLAEISMYFTQSSGFFYRPLTKVYFLLASLLFWFKPEGYHSINLLLHIGSSVLVYLLVRRISHALTATLTAVFFLVASIHHENVIWISGVSSLAGSFFALLSLYLWTFIHRHFWGVVSLIFSLLSLAVSMLFYEEMMFLPFILVVYQWIFGKKTVRTLSLLTIFMTGIYWWVRTSAHAIPPSGSYGINMAALPLNAIGNILGYILMTLLGPWSLGFYTTLRELLRNSPLIAFVLILLASCIGILLIRRYRTRIVLSRTTTFFALFTIIALLPVLGLGNIAERYGYLASASLSYLFVQALLSIAHEKRGAVVAGAIFLISIEFNYSQLTTILRDWDQAGKTSEKILSEMRKKYYPLAPHTSFVVSNVPTRIGRAWVFPVGLEDGAYHVFNDSTMKLDVVGSAQDALRVKAREPTTTIALIIVDDKEHPVVELYE